MNRKDTERLTKIIDQVNRLMDAPPKVNAAVTNADVIECMLGDIINVRGGREPFELAALIERDEA